MTLHPFALRQAPEIYLVQMPASYNLAIIQTV